MDIDHSAEGSHEARQQRNVAYIVSQELIKVNYLMTYTDLCSNRPDSSIPLFCLQTNNDLFWYTPWFLHWGFLLPTTLILSV
jgi:hypothetical protein